MIDVGSAYSAATNILQLADLVETMLLGGQPRHARLIVENLARLEAELRTASQRSRRRRGSSTRPGD